MTQIHDDIRTGKVTMLYDGGCPLCSREIAHYRRVDKHNRVHWADIQKEPQILHNHGISHVEAMKFLHAIDSNGNIVRGVPAFRTIWAELPYYRFLAKIARLPGLSFMLDQAYAGFARQRFKKRMNCTTNK